MSVGGTWEWIKAPQSPRWQGASHRREGPARPRLPLAGTPEAAAGRLEVQCAGTFVERAALDKTLGTDSAAEDEFLAAAFDRWGTDAFSRLRGRYAAVVFDEARGTVHAVRSKLGPPLVLKQTKESLLFSSSVELDEGCLDAWLLGGPHPQVLEPGIVRTYLADATFTDAELRTFMPPRQPPWTEDYGRWLKDRLGLGDDAPWSGDSNAADFFGHCEAHRSAPEAGALLAAARACTVPLAWSRLLEVAELGTEPFTGVWQLGLREALGGTSLARRAYLRRLAQAVEGQPDAATMKQAWNLARPVMQQGLSRYGGSQFVRSAHAVVARWSRHLPRQITPPAEPETPVPQVSADAFVDVRWAQLTDSELDNAVHLALHLGHRPRVPFVESSGLEAVFSRRLNGDLVELFGPASPAPPIRPTSPDVARHLPAWKNLVREHHRQGIDEDRLLGLGVYRAARL